MLVLTDFCTSLVVLIFKVNTNTKNLSQSHTNLDYLCEDDNSKDYQNTNQVLTLMINICKHVTIPHFQSILFALIFLDYNLRLK